MAAKPTRLKILQGNPGKRPLNKREPMPTLGIPDPPADLPPRVAAHWTRAGKILLSMGVVTVAEGDALFILCRAMADYYAYCEAAPVGSDVLIGPTKEDGSPGGMYWNFAASARDKAEARLMDMLKQFGLTPSSRSKLVTVKPSNQEDVGKKRFFGT